MSRTIVYLPYSQQFFLLSAACEQVFWLLWVSFSIVFDRKPVASRLPSKLFRQFMSKWADPSLSFLSIYVHKQTVLLFTYKIGIFFTMGFWEEKEQNITPNTHGTASTAKHIHISNTHLQHNSLNKLLTLSQLVRLLVHLFLKINISVTFRAFNLK